MYTYVYIELIHRLTQRCKALILQVKKNPPHGSPARVETGQSLEVT